MRYLLVLLVLLVVGCGPAAIPFEGTYSGTLDAALVCDDGSNGMHTGSVVWKLSEPTEGGTIAITIGGNSPIGCSLINATRDGNPAGKVATVGAVFCPSTGNNSLMVQDVIKSGGTLTLEGTNLKIDMGIASNLTFGSGAKAQCSGPMHGTIIRN